MKIARSKSAQSFTFAEALLFSQGCAFVFTSRSRFTSALLLLANLRFFALPTDNNGRRFLVPLFVKEFLKRATMAAEQSALSPRSLN